MFLKNQYHIGIKEKIIELETQFNVNIWKEKLNIYLNFFSQVVFLLNSFIITNILNKSRLTGLVGSS